jgi:cell division septation protein DedD
MSVAENRRNYPDHSDDPPARKLGGDPLAELARLIGQSDPFDDPGHRAGTRDDHHARAAHPDYGHPSHQSSGHEAEYDDRHDDQHLATHDRGYRADESHAEGDTYHDQQHGDDRYRVARPAPAEYEDGFYAEDGHMPPHGEEHYAPRRRGGMLTIAAVLGLAVIGTAGAFGYRAFTSPSTGSENPPVIKADTTPAKIVPPAPASSDTAAKPFQERIAGGGGSERVVPREEQPVSLPLPPRANAPAAAATAQGAFASAPASAPLAAPPGSVPQSVNEPKRVRTMTIRPDAAGTDTAPATTQSVPASARTTAPAAAAPSAKQTPSGPMAIAPPSEPSSRTKLAARTPPEQAAGGAYVVQVSAQKTEDEAQSSYRALQQKYPGVLGSRNASIRRADLGDKGVYYRAQVGPFASSEQASTFCNSLKEAGGQCIVQKN